MGAAFLLSFLTLELFGSALVLGFFGLFACCEARFDELVSEAAAHVYYLSHCMAIAVLC